MKKSSYKTTKSSFTFNKVLDTNFLNHHYEDDIEQIYLVFGIFLSATSKEFEALVSTIETTELEVVIQKIHKIKPNFLLVGLQEVYVKLNNLELNGLLIGKQVTSHKIRSIYQIYEEIYLPILLTELESLKKILSGPY